jgi:hypothetical protein
VKLHFRHELPCSPDEFWATFFDPIATERSYREALAATEFEIRSQTGDLASGLTRELHYAQPIDAPGPVKKLMGSEAASTETGTWDPAAGTWTFRLRPDTMGDKITIAGTLRVEPAAAGCIRVFEIDAAVKIFGIGKVFEGFVERQARDAQDATAAWLRTELA